MIKIIGIQEQNVMISEAYIAKDDSAVQISNMFSENEDDQQYHCFTFSEYGVVMINDGGVWTDFELMTPSFLAVSPCNRRDDIRPINGFPLIRAEGKPCNAKVEKTPHGFTLWLEHDQVIDTIITNNNAQFLCLKEVLVGINVINKESD